MSVAAALAVTAAFVAVFRKPLKRAPGVFYALALVLDALLLLGRDAAIPVVLWRAILSFHTHCLPAFSLFAVVMFVGVLAEGSRLRRALVPIRTELSVLASILAIGHVVNYANLAADRLVRGDTGAMSLALVVALACAILLIPLALTSLKAVKRRMVPAAWKNLQRLAYVFWMLVLVHALLMLGPSAAGGAVAAQQGTAVYATLLVLYGVLRVRRAVVDRSERRALGSAGASTLSPLVAPSGPASEKGVGLASDEVSR